MALNKKISVLAIDKQTSFGTLAATRKYGLALRGGDIFNPGLDQAYEELTIATRVPPAAYRSAFLWTVDVTSRAWPRSVVMLLENALGSRVTTGAADPFLHTITNTAAAPGYLTAATRLDTEYHKIRDCRVDQLSFTWDQAEPIEMGCRLMGTVATPYTTSGDPTTDDSGQTSFFPAGGTFALDSDSTTPVVADITGGSITINNHLEPVRASRQLEPIDVWPGWQEITVVLRVIPTNTTLWRSIVTGADAGTAVSNVPVYGSFHTLWTITAGTRDLDFAASRMPWTPGAYPNPTPAGGPAEIELTSTVVDTTPNAFTALVHNQEAATNYTGS